MGRHPLLLPYLALGAVFFFWGTTYAGIRMALESFPPLLLVGVRFTVSGSLLLGGSRLARLEMPGRRDAVYSALFGLLVLGVGNTSLTFAETWIPSGLAALFLTTAPFWLTGLEAAQKGGEPLRAPIVAGMLIGLAGTLLLVGPGWKEGLTGNVMKGFLVLQFGCFCWNLGSILQRRSIRHVNAVVSGALQQLAAGLAFLTLSFVIPQPPVNWSARGVGALLYLVVFGSIVGYTSFVYTLKTLPVAMVALHNYVNPVVAAVLGWLVFREQFGQREIAAMAIIFLGVAIVRRFSVPREAVPPPKAATPSEEPWPP